MIFIFRFTRIPGSLIGSAIGDALGAPFEGDPKIHQIPQRMTGGGPFSTRRGEYTDDTLQMIALGETLVTCLRFSAIDFLSRLLRIYELHPEFFGPTSREVLERVRGGASPESAASGLSGSGRTNGAVMRGAPIGIFYRPDHARILSTIAAATTHPHPVAGASSGVVNQMISILCRGGSKEEAFFSALNSCENREVRNRIACLSAAPLIPSLDALEAAHVAITCFMEEETFAGMIQTAISHGGDTDTTAAICGALGGAFLGAGGIPREWIDDLEGAAALLELEESVWERGER